ncbi:DNA polymerase Y family protein [Hyphomonas sp.]|uniref:Y-family DNA polymerase n=1 Tax=Hyphomonas sp. TaxID=87 RepID=UPI0025BC9F3E|nr:DNA polymerase Y family protein [Hyphomonas sp.]
MKRFLCVWCPDWPLTRLRRARRAHRTGSARPASGKAPDPCLPFALLESGTKGLCIAAANEPARQLGVTEGLAFADARARAPGLVTEDMDPAADARALAALGNWMIRFAPLVALDGTDGLILETTGCDHLYGGEPAMLETLSGLLERNAIPHRLGLAGTPGAASALSRAAPGTCLPEGGEQTGLSGLPVAALRLSPEAETLLRRFGLTRIGQLYGIDRKALGRRFQSRSAADAVLLRLDQALGLRHEPLAPLRPLPLRSVRLNCPEPIATSDAIRIGLERLTQELCEALSATGIGARHFLLTAFKSDGTRSELETRAARPVREPKHILRLFRERIDTIDPGFGIDLLLLEAHRTDAMETSPMALSGDLASTDMDATALSALADRVMARLGERSVTLIRPCESHVPERAEQHTQFDGDAPVPAVPSPVAGPRPIRLLSAPERVTVMAEVPDSPPLRFIWRRVPRTVTRADGPERIAPEWWTHIAAPQAPPALDGQARTWLTPKMDPRADAAQIVHVRADLETLLDTPSEPVKLLPRARDYYRVEDAAGRRYWLFREGLYGDGRGGPPEWYVHGLFA